MTVLRMRALPIEPLPGGRWINRRLLAKALIRKLPPAHRTVIAIGRPSALALAALESVPHEWSAYDAMDDFPEFYRGLSKQSVRRLEEEIAGRVTTVLTSSSALWTKFEALGDRRVMVKNGFEMASLPPLDATDARPPVLGYLGTVGDWFDWDMLCELAASVPSVRLHIVGPRVTTPSALPPNITLLPECSHEAAVEHMRGFAVGLIPFKRNRLTDAVDPIKYYAYRAMGLPVLSTRFGEMAARARTDGVFFLDSGMPADAALAALRFRPTAEATRQFRQQHDWTFRFSESGLFDRVLSC
jgi:hypothetical protein